MKCLDLIYYLYAKLQIEFMFVLSCSQHNTSQIVTTGAEFDYTIGGFSITKHTNFTEGFEGHSAGFPQWSKMRLEYDNITFKLEIILLQCKQKCYGF